MLNHVYKYIYIYIHTYIHAMPCHAMPSHTIHIQLIGSKGNLICPRQECDIAVVGLGCQLRRTRQRLAHERKWNWEAWDPPRRNLTTASGEVQNCQVFGLGSWVLRHPTWTFEWHHPGPKPSQARAAAAGDLGYLGMTWVSWVNH